MKTQSLLVALPLTMLFMFPNAYGQTGLESKVQEFETKHNVKFVLKGHPFGENDDITGQDSTPKKVANYLPILLSEFDLYPADVLNRARVKKIVVCKKLAYRKQLRGAIPGWNSGIMFYDAERASHDVGYLRSIVHHEFFHQIDFMDDGKVYQDKEWVKLNPKDFKYGRGGVHVQDDPTQGVTYNKPGFMNKYSTQGVEEDKAEIFAYMISEPKMMKQRAKDDPIVAAKIKMMKRICRSFAPSMNDEFWKRVDSVDRKKSNATRRVALQKTALEKMNGNAKSVRDIIKSDVGKQFLEATPHLPSIPTFDLYYKTDGPANPVGGLEGILPAEYEKLSPKEQKQYESLPTTESAYYFTRYGSPVAFVRALDLVGHAGLKTLEGKRIVDFGCGTIGHLRMMASNGADVTGIDVNKNLKGLYSRPGDQGKIKRFGKDESREQGNLKVLIGSFPGDKSLTTAIGGELDLFISKNTLKKGYIHPAQKVDPKRQVRLGVSDDEFMKAVYQRLKPGGFFMIYNFHPKRTEPGDAYMPHSDGRSPFSKDALEKTGFKILKFDADDTEFAHKLAEGFGWAESMELEKDFRATYTLMQK